MATAAIDSQVADVLALLKRRGSKRNRDGMARYAIVAPKAFGVSVGTIRDLGKQFGRDRALAAALWETGWYEARMLATLIDDPELVTPAQMERWARAKGCRWAYFSGRKGWVRKLPSYEIASITMKKEL